MNLSLWCTRIIKWTFYLLFILVPLILTPINYELFEYNKMMVTYALCIIIISAWIVKMIHDREIRIAKTPLDIPIALFVVSQFVSSLFSIDPHVSWNGYYSRFNGGMWSIISYVLLYYAFVSNFGTQTTQSAGTEELRIKNKESRKKQQNQQFSSSSLLHLNSLFIILNVALATATIVSLYGVAERLGVDKHLWVQDVQTRVFSTLGQPNWLAAYLAALIPLTFAFGLSSVFWILVSVLFFLVLLFTRSRSGLMGFAVVDCVFWLLWYIRKKQISWRPIVFVHALFALILFINGSNIAQIDTFFSLGALKKLVVKTQQTSSPVPASTTPTGPVLETGGTESGTIRKYVWQAAITAWKSSNKTFLIGTGTETFAFAFYQFRPTGHNLTSEWDFLYNKAHNEYLNYLATTGIFGLGSYLFFIGAFIAWFTKIQILKLKAQKENLNFEFWNLEFALFAGWFSILVTNFFGFSVVIIQLFFFLFPAMLIAINDQPASPARLASKRAGGQSTVNDIHIKLPRWHPTELTLGATIISSILITILILHWQADTLYATAYRSSRNGQYATSLSLIDQAIRLNSGEPIYRDERATILASFALALLEEKNASGASELARRSMTESDLATSISPKNVNFWKTRTKIYYSLASFDATYNKAAIGALEKASELSPNDPKIYYNLAILNGRENNIDQAIMLLQKTKELKPNYRDAYYALYVFYSDNRKPDLARAIITEYLTRVDSTDKQFVDILGKQKQ